MKTIKICKNCWKLYYDILNGYVCDVCTINLCVNCVILLEQKTICKHCSNEVRDGKK